MYEQQRAYRIFKFVHGFRYSACFDGIGYPMEGEDARLDVIQIAESRKKLHLKRMNESRTRDESTYHSRGMVKAPQVPNDTLAAQIPTADVGPKSCTGDGEDQ